MLKRTIPPTRKVMPRPEGRGDDIQWPSKSHHHRASDHPRLRPETRPVPEQFAQGRGTNSGSFWRIRSSVSVGNKIRVLPVPWHAGPWRKGATANPTRGIVDNRKPPAARSTDPVEKSFRAPGIRPLREFVRSLCIWTPGEGIACTRTIPRIWSQDPSRVAPRGASHGVGGDA